MGRRSTETTTREPLLLVGIKVDAALRDRIREAAAKEDRTVSAFVRRTLREVLQPEARRESR